MQEISDQLRHSWVLLTYSLPREPSAPRVATWRKLKQLGALCLYDGPWVLPANKATEEHFRWLALDIRQKGGEAMLWRAENLTQNDEAQLTQQFEKRSEDEYHAVLAALEAGESRQDAARRFLQVQKTDYFSVPLGHEVRQAVKGEAL